MDTSSIRPSDLPLVIDALAIPTREELHTTLLAYRYTLVGGERHVWLCCTDERGWFLTDKRSDVGGINARCTVGKGDSNGALDHVARYLISAITETARILSTEEDQ